MARKKRRKKGKKRFNPKSNDLFFDKLPLYSVHLNKPTTNITIPSPLKTAMAARRALNKKIQQLRDRNKKALKKAYKPRKIDINPSNGILRMNICRARKVRQEVLHALKKTGKGSSKKQKIITIKSKIKC